MDSILGGLSNLRVDTVLSAVDKYVPGAQNKIKNLADKAKAYVNNLSELEMKVMEATNHEPWGPHGTVMQEITNASFNSEGFYQIMGICDQRLSEGPDNWRLVYKTLLLLEYMCKHGPLSVAEALSSYSRISQLEKLRDRFEYKDPAGRDQGVNVRQRAGVLVSLVQDRDKLREERDKAAKNKSKYTGVSSSTMSYGGFGSGSSSYDTSSYSNKDYGSSTTSTSYQRSSSGGTSGHSSGFGSSSMPAAAAADPVEATRQRIARLKSEGVIKAEITGDGSDSVGPGLESPSAVKKQPKKLSEIRIDPVISAVFAKGGLAPPPGSSKHGSAGGSGTGAAAVAGSSGLDLLGDLDVSAAATSTNTTAAAAGSTVKGWDGFSSSAAAAGGAAADDDWSAFDSASTSTAASSKTVQQKGPIDINALLGPLPTTTSAAATGTNAPLPLNDFSMTAAAAAPIKPAAAAAADPFGPFVAPPTAASKPSAAVATSKSSFSQDPFATGSSSSSDPFAGSSFTSAPSIRTTSASSTAAVSGVVGGASDPFAASGVVHMLPQASKQQSGVSSAAKLGPETAKAKDPFADLAFI